MLSSWSSISQTGTVKIPVEIANRIVDDLKELDTLRHANRINNLLIPAQRKQISNLGEIIKAEKLTNEILRHQIDLYKKKAGSWFSRALDDTWKYLAGFALGVVTLSLAGS